MATVVPCSSVSRTASTSPSAATRCACTQFCICIAIPRTGRTGCLGGLADSPAQPKSAPGSLSKNASGCGHGLWLDICVARTARCLGQRDGRASPSSRRDRPTGQVQPNVAGRHRSRRPLSRRPTDRIAHRPSSPRCRSARAWRGAAAPVRRKRAPHGRWPTSGRPVLTARRTPAREPCRGCGTNRRCRRQHRRPSPTPHRHANRP